MRYFAKLMILLAFISFSHSASGQEAPKPPSDYQDYLKMMKDLNDLNKKYGMKTVIPLSKTKWKKLYGKDQVYTPPEIIEKKPHSQPEERY